MSQMVNYWAKADAAFDRGQQAYLDWCRELAVLYSEGMTTQEAIADRYEQDKGQINKALTVGKSTKFRGTKLLPKSQEVLYLLTTLPDDAFEELCKPTTTQARIRSYKQQLAKQNAAITALQALIDFDNKE